MQAGDNWDFNKDDDKLNKLERFKKYKVDKLKKIWGLTLYAMVRERQKFRARFKILGWNIHNAIHSTKSKVKEKVKMIFFK